jgi:hypothetical protein
MWTLRFLASAAAPSPGAYQIRYRPTEYALDERAPR